ncbi:MAG: hypothetical protein KA767_13175 [Saprospiraceae bacterium]|nr:hypothetical protein [Saprospiraceae bacterium]MBP7644288.1 hypothetical protein [Saprospiraceae bacterium]
MKERKAHYALKMLDAYELNAFRKFLSSPFFNQKESMITYLDILVEAMKKENGIHELVEQNVWNLIFDQPFDEVKFRKLNSDFNTLIEKFLIQKEFEEDPHIANYYKINAFKKRNATKLYDSLINDIDVSRRTDPNRNAQYFLNQYNIEKGIFGLIPEDERKMDFKSGNYGLDIDKISENLDIYFISEKLKYYTEILSWNQLYHTNLNIRGIEIVMKLANNPLFKEIPVIAVFSKIIQIKLEPENEEHYFELKNLVSQCLHLFPKSEGKEIIDAMLNYCINKVNKGISKFESESLEIYKTALDTESILVNGYLETSDYRNIAVMGLRVGELDWVENFIHAFAAKLDEKFRNNAFYFSLARLETYKGDFSKVIEYVSNIVFDDVWYNLNARSLLIAAYYELGETTVLDSLLQSFRVYVTREKSLTKTRKTHYLNLISFTRNLLNIDLNDRSKLEKLREKVVSTQGVVNKTWILEKISALEQKPKYRN